MRRMVSSTLRATSCRSSDSLLARFSNDFLISEESTSSGLSGPEKGTCVPTMPNLELPWSKVMDSSSRNVTLPSVNRRMSFLIPANSSFPKQATMGRLGLRRKSIASITFRYSTAFPKFTMSPASKNKSGLLRSEREFANSRRNLGLWMSATAAILN